MSPTTVPSYQQRWQEMQNEAKEYLAAYKRTGHNPVEESYMWWQGKRYTQTLMGLGYCKKIVNGVVGGAWAPGLINVTLLDQDTGEYWTVVCRNRP